MADIDVRKITYGFPKRIVEIASAFDLKVLNIYIFLMHSGQYWHNPNRSKPSKLTLANIATLKILMIR